MSGPGPTFGAGDLAAAGIGEPWASHALAAQGCDYPGERVLRAAGNRQIRWSVGPDGCDSVRVTQTLTSGATAELMCWPWTEWRDDPEAVMGAMLTLAAGAADVGAGETVRLRAERQGPDAQAGTPFPGAVLVSADVVLQDGEYMAGIAAGVSAFGGLVAQRLPEERFAVWLSAPGLGCDAWTGGRKA